MLRIDISRHMELFNPITFTTPVHVIGTGATGSWVALMLAKLGVQKITLWDFDVVEEHNIANQAFGLDDVGKPKVFALQESIIDLVKADVRVRNEKVESQLLSGIVFLMVDSMAERKKIFDNCLKFNPNVQHVIEPRMGLDEGRVYNVNPNDMHINKRYMDTFYTDEQASVSACGASTSVITSATTIAAWCVRQMINFVNNIELDNEILLDFKYNNVVTYKWNPND